MKICFISHSGYMGGAERALLEILDIFISNGVECYVLVPHDGPLCRHLKHRSITFAIIKYKPWAGGKNVSFFKIIRNQIINIYSIIPALYVLIKWNCDIIYTNTIII